MIKYHPGEALGGVSLPPTVSLPFRWAPQRLKDHLLQRRYLGSHAGFEDYTRRRCCVLSTIYVGSSAFSGKCAPLTLLVLLTASS